MKDEFDVLIKMFSEEDRKKEKIMEEIFQKTIEFFDRYKEVIASGSEEEKALMRKKMETLREKLKEEGKNFQGKTGLTFEEIKTLAKDPKNFTAREWEFMQKAKERIQMEKKDMEKRKMEKAEARAEALKEKSKRKPQTKKSGWMKS